MTPEQWRRWGVLIMAATDSGRPDQWFVSGHSLEEWLGYVQADYDWIDRELYLDSIGG